MPRQSPSVVEGLRGPRQERMAKDREAPPSEPQGIPEALTKRPNATVYESKYAMYRLQVAVSDDVRNPYTGRSEKGRIIAAQFKDNVFVNDSKDVAIRDLIDEVLQANEFFGKKDAKGNIPSHAHYWLATDAAEARKTASLNAAKNALKALPPEQVEAFMAELKHGKAEDHKLPERPTV